MLWGNGLADGNWGTGGSGGSRDTIGSRHGSRDAILNSLTVVGRLHTIRDARGNLTTPWYDGVGRPRVTVDALGHRTTNVYDGAGPRSPGVAQGDWRGVWVYEMGGVRVNSRLQSVAMYASVPVAFALFAGGGLAGLRVSRSPMYQRHMLLVAACVGVLSLGLYVWLVWLRRAASVSQPSAHASRCPPVAILCLMCLVVTTLNAPLSGLWESVSAWPVELPKALVLEAFLLGVLWARWSEYAAQRSREEGRRPDGEGSKSVDG